MPGDPSQVIYVWWDALGNYITSLNYGAQNCGASGSRAADYRRWWTGADRRIHVVGKGVLRFHAVYWPAILLSAGEPLPTEIFVHDYLTIDGSKISKSATGPALESSDPVGLTGPYGADALRWWLLREVPRVGDTDFTVDKLIARANEDLANGLGNLVNRVVSLAAFIPERGHPGLRSSARHQPMASGRGRRASWRQRRRARIGWPDWPADAAALRAAIERAPCCGPGGARQVRLPGRRRRRSGRSSSRRTATWRRRSRGTWPGPSEPATRSRVTGSTRC